MKSPECLQSRNNYSAYFYNILPVTSLCIYVYIYVCLYLYLWFYIKWKHNINTLLQSAQQKVGSQKMLTGVFLPDLGASLVPNVGHNGWYSLISQTETLLRPDWHSSSQLSFSSILLNRESMPLSLYSVLSGFCKRFARVACFYLL